MDISKLWRVGRWVLLGVVLLLVGYGLARLTAGAPQAVTPAQVQEVTREVTKQVVQQVTSEVTREVTRQVTPEDQPDDQPNGHGNRLDPLTIPKFVEPMVIPPVMPPLKTGSVTEYAIAVRQFEQQILPAGLPMTTVWGYGRLGDPLPGSGQPTTFNYPAFTVETRANETVQVNWVNQLVDDPDSANPKFLPHLLPVDQTIHWANPGPKDVLDPRPYLGPVGIITHVHGAHVASHSDGLPEAWYMPNASDLPAGYLTEGPNFSSQAALKPGESLFEYSNDQRAATLWYHDHALGITRLNVYAGMAGFWLLRDDEEDALNLPGPAPRLNDPADTRYYEIPIAIQDKSFNADGSLFYPDSRTFFDEYPGPYVPDTRVPPIWNPEFFGDSIVVNGKTWPYLEVEPRLYRLRLLNGSNSRYLVLKTDKPLAFNQIGAEGGLLPDQPVVLDQLLMSPAERADVIVDFSNYKPGDVITLLNDGPDSPFGGLPIEASELANPETTGQIMQFRVVEKTNQGNAGVIPNQLPAIERLATTLPERNLTLNEMMDTPDEIPVEATLGTGFDGGLEFWDDITENPGLNDTEIWRMINLTADAHPIHLHLVSFQVLDRIPFDKEAYQEAQRQFIEDKQEGTEPDPLDYVTGGAVPPYTWETGWKDTVTAYPDYITRIIAKFDMEGLYVWHCHILEHEDNEMMRPFYVGVMME